MKTIPYKSTELILIPSRKGCFGCYFLKEMGCYCPKYLECSPFKIFSEVVKEDKTRLSDVVCHEREE